MKSVTKLQQEKAELAVKMKQEYPKVFFILGGKSAILGKDLTKSVFDSFCIGEAEIEFAELLKRLSNGQDVKNIKSFWFKDGNQIIKNELGQLVTDLDSLPLKLKSAQSIS